MIFLHEYKGLNEREKPSRFFMKRITFEYIILKFKLVEIIHIISCLHPSYYCTLQTTGNIFFIT